ncbi:MAG: nucleotidyl transferase [Calditrichaeota bacterium]|nr:MAG: nucleotidyl transferase [Calditrichota bacterium]
MKAIIPVAGVGSKLRPHTNTNPKVMLNVAGKPIIAHIMDRLIEEKIDTAIFVVGYLGDKIEKFVRANYSSVNLKFVEQKEAKGLGHAIYMAQEFMDDSPILITLGDTIFDVNLKEVLKSKTSSLGVHSVENPERFGVALKEGNYIENLVEKPKTFLSKLALVGLYYIKSGVNLKKGLKELLDKDIKTNGEYQLTDALQLMIKNGEKFTTFEVDGWFDCGKSETLLATNRHILHKEFLNGKRTDFETDNSQIIPPVSIGENVKIKNSIIGPYVSISCGSTVENSVIRNSILNKNSILTYSVIESSIIGENASVVGTFKQVNVGDYSEVILS